MCYLTDTAVTDLQFFPSVVCTLNNQCEEEVGLTPGKIKFYAHAYLFCYLFGSMVIL